MTQMTHREALEERAVERYLLDELSGEPRDRFEEHLFDCTLCASDLKAGVLFLEAAKQELLTEAPAPSPIRTWWNSLLQPFVLGSALAASLAVVAYQSAIVLPRVESQLALARTPSVVNTLVLANAGTRGESRTAEIVAPANGDYLLSVDLPPAQGAYAYRCTLYNPSDKAVWTKDVPAAQDLDSLKIRVPASATGAGNNRLDVEAIGSQKEMQPSVTHYSFTLRLEQ